MLKKIGLLISFFALSYFTFCQNQAKADSLRGLIEKGELEGEKELRVYYWLSSYSSSPEDVLNYANELLKLAETAENLEYKLKAYTNIGIAHRLMGDLDEALEYQFKCAKEAIGKEEFIPFMAEVYSEISTCYTQNGDSENALLYGAKTIQLLRGTSRKQELALTLLNFGYDYYLVGEYDSAMAYYNEAEPILEEIDMQVGLAYIIGNRALVYWKKGNAEKAKKDIMLAIEMLKPIGDTYGMADYYNQLSNILIEENAYNQAIEYALKSYDFATSEELKEQARDASKSLYLSYTAIGEFEKALNFQTQYHSLKDSIQNLETTQRLANLRTEFEVGRKQVEVDRLIEQKKSNQIIMIVGGILLVLFICLIIIIYSFLKTKNRLNRKLEEQKNSLQLLNSTKDKFFSIISHDLRGPVNTLSGLVTVSKIYMNEGTKEQTMDMIDKMEHSIGRLTKLLDNLLTWALQQRGHFPHMPEPLSIRFLLDDMTDMFQEMSQSKNIKLDYDLKGDFQLYVDRNTASTILRNLINNAIKFTPNDGHVQIIAEADHDKKIGVIKVIDNGVGMSEEKLQHLFKLNENNSTKGTSGETGLGLGLQLVYDFVKLNKGKVEVESEESKGTKFIITLPLSPE
ncbi:ATP-binding protein [Ekhidna lutea]|uniref:ATP-binding protein n=1 Tax=Ekhidna lutea TaxID=447679 RepID=UPI0015C6972E|nr:tetratricopeptide repeat-containing sensor histidine kinase [Ekhidna lutea]